MSNETVSISVERYNELIRKETIYDIQRMLILKDKYRSDTESIMYGVPTREEEMEFKAALEEIKSVGDTNSKKGEE